MDIEIREFITYLHNTKKNIGKYRDLIPERSEKMAEFLKERGIRNYKDVKELELEGYISYMEREKFCVIFHFPEAVASMRVIFQYLVEGGE